jgi:phospholipid/cholesterol/gamma-HCH transport system substrate-binding protein
MKDKTRNLLVGLTVMTALAILAGLIIQFQELPGFLRLGYDLKLTFPETGGAGVGSDVFLAGKRIGRIAEMQFTGGDPRQGVTFTAVIDRDVRVPGDVNAYVKPKGLMGGSLLEFRTDGRPPGASRTDPQTGRKLEWLPTDGSVVVAGQLAGYGLISPEAVADLRGALTSLKTLADRLNLMLTSPEDLSTGTASAPTVLLTSASGPATRRQPNLYVTLARLDSALEAVNKILGDDANQANLKATLANLKDATARAGDVLAQAQKMVPQVQALLTNTSGAVAEVRGLTTRASDKVQELAVKLIGDADRLGEVLTEVGRMATKLNEGQGSAGKLFNDPALYNNLVDITTQLKNTMNTLQELLEQWKKQGLKLKL